MIFQHMRFTGSAMVPVGDLLAHLGSWTDVAPADTLAMMRGAAPVSAGASGELERLIAAITHDAAARALLDSDGDPGKTLAELRAFGGDVGTAMSDYLDLVGCRLLDGFDISGRYALELPDALLARDPLVRRRRGQATPTDVDARIAGIRAQVPDEHRAAVRRAARRGAPDVPPARRTGRVQRHLGVRHHAPRRARGRSPRSRARAASTTPSTSSTPASTRCARSSSARADRRPTSSRSASRDRSSRTAKEAPPSLGPPAPPPPDPSGLPPGVARVMHAIGIAMGELFGSSEAPHEENLLRGLAASGGVYEGPARRVSGPTEFGRIVQGDVLVTESTTEAFNILLPLLGAIVTDSGGLLSHSAIVAREYGIPGVVGTRNATDLIPDGTRVRVDGDAGEVTVYA